MHKKIALFSDGTGNSASAPHKTNVWRAYQALDRSPGSGQVAFYDGGVGTSAFSLPAILGLAFGWGLARNVRQIYGFLCRAYKPGDEIYAFGFSRGAFTIRVVVALIADQGIINRDRVAESDLDRLVAAAYRRFRADNFTPSLLSSFLGPLRDAALTTWEWMRGLKPYDPEQNIGHPKKAGKTQLITFVGVWDTVDAYGLPIDELTRAWDKVVWPLTAKDRDLSPRVARARHALALDEQRESFEPMLWNEHGVPHGESTDDARLVQAWFPGVHADVGGSYPDDSLAFVALDWIVDESVKNDGLRYLPQARVRPAEAVPGGPIHDSRSGVGAIYRYAPRNLERLCHERKPGLWNWLKRRVGRTNVSANEVSIARPLIHRSVFDRVKSEGVAYAPINLPRDYAVLDADGTVSTLRDAGPGSVPLPETAEQAALRRERQSYAWNKVWGRRQLYFVTLVLTAFFAAYPYVADATGAGNRAGIAGYLEPFVGTLSFVIRAIPSLVAKIPGLGFAAGWAERYADFPFVFCVLLILIGGLLGWSQRVRASLNDEMWVNWRHVTGIGPKPSGVVGGFRRWLAGMLEARRNNAARPGRIGLEALAVVFLLFMVGAVASRLFFVTVDGFGGVCEINPSQTADLGRPFSFDPKQLCFDTGLALKRGRRYQIAMNVPEDWRDGDIDADVTGWRTAPLYLQAFTPLRRHLLVGWYQPIARIDQKLFDRYPLEAAANSEDDAGPQRDLWWSFTARRDGRLYLYLNDAVVFTSGRFYNNNNGTATVTVTDVSGE